jgi:hypothetical protein
MTRRKLIAHSRWWLRAVDNATALRLERGASEVDGAHALEELDFGARTCRCPRGDQALAADGNGHVEDQRQIRLEFPQCKALELGDLALCQPVTTPDRRMSHP